MDHVCATSEFFNQPKEENIFVNNRDSNNSQVTEPMLSCFIPEMEFNRVESINQIRIAIQERILQISLTSLLTSFILTTVLPFVLFLTAQIAQHLTRSDSLGNMQERNYGGSELLFPKEEVTHFASIWNLANFFAFHYC